ncbi:MAG: helix-turn-helix domain-containing protein [Candidatus Geothermincolia bacterium]
MNYVRKTRQEKGISLSSLGHKARICPGDLSLVERDKHPAYPAWRKRIAAALKTPEVELFPPTEVEGD